MPQKKDENTFFTKKNIMSLIIVFLMISSVLAIWQGSQDPNELPSYNDNDIFLEDNKYRIETAYGNIYGYFYPTVLESIALEQTLVTFIFSSPTIIVLFDPTDPHISYIEVLRRDLAFDDLPLLGKTVSFGITEVNEIYPYTVVQCATTSEPTLYLRTDNTTTLKIYQDAGCVVLEASSWEELVQLKDRFVYTIFGVME